MILLPIALPRIDMIGLFLIAGGGVMYTIGAIIFGLKRPNFNEWWGHHEIWHLFVLFAATLHFFSILVSIKATIA